LEQDKEPDGLPPDLSIKAVREALPSRFTVKVKDWLTHGPHTRSFAVLCARTFRVSVLVFVAMASAHSVAIESIIRSGDTTKLDELLEAHSSERQAIVDLCLFLATSNSNEKFTDFALNNGANPNATQQKGRRGITFPLLATITSGNPKPVIIQRLLTAKVHL
jgi:hypothetical protein